MGSDLVFLTLLLGLVSGTQTIALHAGSDVKAIRLLLDGREIGRLNEAPWRIDVDLGDDFVPGKLEAVAYGPGGGEIARISQLINLPTERAQVEIIREGNSVQLHGRNLEYSPLKQVSATFDGKRLSVDKKLRAQFPADTDWSRPHVVAAQMTFANGLKAQREIVVQGATYSDTAESQLTPVLLMLTSGSEQASYDGCLSLDRSPIAPTAVETGGAFVMFVRDPDAREAVIAYSSKRPSVPAVQLRLSSSTREEVLWPIASRFGTPTDKTLLFQHSGDVSAVDVDVRSLLSASGPFGTRDTRRCAQAVAVAGLRALGTGKRRAVVYVLSTQHTAQDDRDPRMVRRYLQTIGVPLHVWSLSGPRPDLETTWGTVEDISSLPLLRDAVDRLRESLAAQRIAWVRTNPLDALRVRADTRCGVETLVE